MMISVTSCSSTFSGKDATQAKESNESPKGNVEILSAAGAIAGEEANEGLMYQMLYYSDTIVKGEVLEFLEEVHSNPTGEEVNKNGDVIMLAMIAKYRFRVDEVIVGDVEAGDEITVGILNKSGYTADYLANNEVVSDSPEDGYLEIGQNGIFCLCSDGRYQTADDTERLYLVHETGIFDKVNEDGLYVSKRFTIDPADLLELKAQAEEYLGNKK